MLPVYRARACTGVAHRLLHAYERMGEAVPARLAGIDAAVSEGAVRHLTQRSTIDVHTSSAAR
jgi:hypothetical protein